MYWDVALWSAGLWVILSLAAGQLTEQEKSTIVDMHNELRSQVHPSAAFMQKVVRDAPDAHNIHCQDNNKKSCCLELNRKMLKSV